jgi:SAM-dependent methyltransferase
VVDIGGGNGTLARSLAEHGVNRVVVDRAQLVAQAPRPVTRADACRLPFRDNTFDGAAALWMLYHLHDPLVALREAHRVLRTDGLLAVSVPSRYNDPELAAVLPAWGQPLSFDAENGPGQLRHVFDVVDIQRWDAPLAHIPDHDALALYLRGRGMSEERAHTAARRVTTPLTITKRGMLCWSRKT